MQLYDPDLNDTQKRYAQARIEIQVASVLMHGWSEVEHDLVYKPFQGHLSVEEYAILDELNGLVMAGEIALERLQKAGEARVSDSGRPFTDYFDLAVHLLDRASSILGGSFGDAALGRVDLLFDFLAKVNLCTPQQIATYISALHDDTEERPIAEQIVDQILAEDQSRYGAWESVRASRQGSSQQFSDAHAPSRGVTHEEMGRFLAAWIAFERANQDRAAKSISPSSSQIKYLPIMRLVESSGVYEASEISEIDRIRRLRNTLVHGVSSIDSRDLNEASHLLSSLKGKLPVNKAKAIKRSPRQSKRTNPRKSRVGDPRCSAPRVQRKSNFRVAYWGWAKPLAFSRQIVFFVSRRKCCILAIQSTSRHNRPHGRSIRLPTVTDLEHYTSADRRQSSRRDGPGKFVAAKFEYDHTPD